MAMNASKTPTRQKVMIPLRLSQEIYALLAEEVHLKKKDERGYSMNQYLTELLEKDLKAKRRL